MELSRPVSPPLLPLSLSLINVIASIPLLTRSILKLTALTLTRSSARSLAPLPVDLALVFLFEAELSLRDVISRDEIRQDERETVGQKDRVHGHEESRKTVGESRLDTGVDLGHDTTDTQSCKRKPSSDFSLLAAG